MEYQQAKKEFEISVNKTIEEIEQKAKQRGVQAANVLTNEVKKCFLGSVPDETIKSKERVENLKEMVFIILLLHLGNLLHYDLAHCKSLLKGGLMQNEMEAV